MTETMTVHKALAELKTLTARIEKEIESINFAAVNKHSSDKIGGKPISEYVNKTRDTYKSINTLINRRNAIKRAVTMSNAVTEVEIAGIKYRVAEAIDMKAMGMNFQRSLLNRIESQYNACKYKAEQENSRLETRADEYIMGLFGNTEGKTMPDNVKDVRKTFVEQQTMDLIDPIKAEDEIKKLRDMIDAFTTEVDAALSVSNAITKIEVEYTCE